MSKTSERESDNMQHAVSTQTTSFRQFVIGKMEVIAPTKDDAQIAHELGYHGPRIIQLIRRGEARLPLDKVRLLANAINADAGYLVRLWLAQYLGEDSELLGPIVSANEAAILAIIREASSFADPAVNETQARRLVAIFRPDPAVPT
jgi:hypothetical protein